MAKNYYGCIPVLAWLLCHYFYNREHYVWVAERYYPYRLPNPRSSNPHRIYEDLYEPWMDADNFDKYISQTRLSLRNGVEAKEKAGVIMPADATRLKKICDKVEVTFFCPIVLRLDIDQIDGARCVFRPIVTAHSEKGVTGDSEVVTGDSDLIVTDLGRRRNHRSRCRNRRSRSNRNGLCGQRGNHLCHGYPRALCVERGDAGGADCHAQHQGAVTAQVRLRALA